LGGTLNIGFITIDCADPDLLIGFWTKALGYEVHEGVYVTIRDPEKVHPTLYFQRVPERKTAKNRVHMDLVSEDFANDLDRLTGWGASKIRDVSENGISWTILEDPEGNEFCLFDAAPAQPTA
jgi:hypothetical protein